MENVEQMSLIEIATQLMEEHDGLYNIYELIRDTLAKKGLDISDIDTAAQLYVDMIASSNFVYMGEDMWDLKSRQSLEQYDKDGSDFVTKEEEYQYETTLDDNDDEDLDDLSEDELDDEDEDLDDEDEYDEESDEDDLDDEESEEGELEDDEELETYTEEGFNEDKYNDLMDDYEDMYDDK